MKEQEKAQDHDLVGRLVCPACGAELIQEKCKIVCRSQICQYRLIYNCSEF